VGTTAQTIAVAVTMLLEDALIRLPAFHAEEDIEGEKARNHHQRDERIVDGQHGISQS
jgi:hypothetical protein